MAEENCRTILLDDGSRYDLDHLESDELLCDLKDWDYPIFDLLERYNRSILSAVRKRGPQPLSLYTYQSANGAFMIGKRVCVPIFDVYWLSLAYIDRPRDKQNQQ